MKLTTEQARERIDEVKDIIKARHMCESMDGECSKEDVQDYRERFEALQMGADALEKQIPKEHHHSAIKEVDGKGVYFRFSICPNCLSEIISYKNDEPPKYCNECGQKIDWSDN